MAIPELPTDRDTALPRSELHGDELKPALEAGTPPEDRRFRPDIQGLRAIAVLLVAFEHSGVKFLSQGYVGVDVFFVISGYVITGIILRETDKSGGLGIGSFYARRVRRILPAALLVIVVTILAERIFVGAVAATEASRYGRIAALFVANLPTLVSVPPHETYASPFGAYWSLSVEEQFYLVYPLLVAGSLLIPIWTLRSKLCVVLCAVIFASFWYSVTRSPGVGSLITYTSPFARAWELSLGCLLAIFGRELRHIPRTVGAVASWVGLATILAASHFMNPQQGGYPGYIAAWPTLGALLLIAGGLRAPRLGAEWMLKQRSFQAVGRWSYSIYLWHYPILILAAQRFGPLTVPENLLLVGVAIFLSAATYRLVEDPIRRTRFVTRSAWLSIGVGLLVVGLVVGMLSAFI